MDRKAFRFFFDHAGYVVGERALCAAILARAESEVANSPDYRFRWEADQDADMSFMTDREREQDHFAEGCILERRCGECGEWEHMESLWGIIDADPAYRRVVQAELAAQLTAQASR